MKWRLITIAHVRVQSKKICRWYTANNNDSNTCRYGKGVAIGKGQHRTSSAHLHYHWGKEALDPSIVYCVVWSCDSVHLVHCHMITPFTKLFAPLKWVLPKHSYFIFIVEGSQSLTESGFASRPRHTVQRELFASCVELDLNMTQIPLTQYICRGPRKTSLTTCQPKSPLKLISPTCTVHQGRAK